MSHPLLLLFGVYLALNMAMTTCPEHAPGQQNTAPFHFNVDEANARYSLKQSEGKWPVQTIEAPGSGNLVFQFTCKDKQRLSVEGHGQSVFRIANDTLFFAHFVPTRTGCAVAAYDLDTCKELWRTKLEGLGNISHEQYRNRVTMDLSNNDVSIRGNETYGDYIEVLDQKTGKQVAHKVYRRSP